MLDVAAIGIELAALGAETDVEFGANSEREGTDAEGSGDADGDDECEDSGGEEEQTCADNEESSSDESDAAAEVGAARAVRSTHFDNALIATMEARAEVSAGGVDAQGRSQRRRQVVITTRMRSPNVTCASLIILKKCRDFFNKMINKSLFKGSNDQLPRIFKSIQAHH
jgi:hypothetical protein